MSRIQTGDANAVSAVGLGNAYGIVAVGAVVGKGGSTDAVKTTVGNAARLVAGRNLTLQTTASHDVATMTTAASGGLLAGEGSDAAASVTTADATTVGDGTTLTAKTGNVAGPDDFRRHAGRRRRRDRQRRGGRRHLQVRDRRERQRLGQARQS